MTGQILRFWYEFRTWLIVAVITVLIWLYAEGNTLDTRQKEVEITFVASPTLFVIPPANLGPVTVTYRCRRDRQGDLERELEKGPIQIEVTDVAGAPDTRQSILLKDRLANYEPIASMGATIEDVSPFTVALEVYHKGEKSLPIKVIADGIELKAPGATTTPADAVIDLPLEKAADLDQESLEVRLTQESVANLPDNVPQVAPLRVIIPESIRQKIPAALLPQLQPRPVTVDVSFTLANQTATWKPPKGIPLQVMLPLEAAGKYIVEARPEDRFHTDIEFTGPPTAIARLSSGEDKARLFVELTLADLEQARVEKVPILDVSPRVTATPRRTVILTIKKLEETPLDAEPDTTDEEVVTPPPALPATP